MTLRGVIQGLLRGSDDAEALLAEDGFGDLPAEMFGQALASYADTAAIEEADTLTPILAELGEGDPADVFAVLEEHPLATRTDLDGIEALGLPVLAGNSLDPEDLVDGFGTPAEADEPTGDEIDADDDATDSAAADVATADHDATEAGSDTDLDGSPQSDHLDDPFADEFEDADASNETDTFEDLFDHEPVATGDDPSDLDLDF